jgi:hypothetical protein
MKKRAEEQQIVLAYSTRAVLRVNALLLRHNVRFLSTITFTSRIANAL